MVADDSTIMAKISSAQDNVELQRDLDRVVDWAEKWQASFNVKKCKFLHFGKNNPGYQYSMRDPLSPKRLTLENTGIERDLGILILHNLKWEQQVSKMVYHEPHKNFVNFRKLTKFPKSISY